MIAFGEGRLPEAIAEFRTGVDSPSAIKIRGRSLLGRAYDLAGERDKAIEAYAAYVETPESLRFLIDRCEFAPTQAAFDDDRVATLWENADPSLQHRVRTSRPKVKARAGELTKR
jgi:hypothetical protein